MRERDYFFRKWQVYGSSNQNNTIAWLLLIINPSILCTPISLEAFALSFFRAILSVSHLTVLVISKVTKFAQELCNMISAGQTWTAHSSCAWEQEEPALNALVSPAQSQPKQSRPQTLFARNSTDFILLSPFYHNAFFHNPFFCTWACVT